MTLSEREVAVDLIDIANDLMTDIRAAVRLWRDVVALKDHGIVFHPGYLDRVVISHLTIACFKVEELFTHPPYCRLMGIFEVDWRRDVRKRIYGNGHGISQLRSAYMGHIHDKSGRPMRANQLVEIYHRELGPTYDDLFRFALEDERSVYQLLSAIRSEFTARFQIAPEEILER